MENLLIKAGTKLYMRLESRINDSSYLLKSTFVKKIDETLFLISVPTSEGSVKTIEKTDKIYMNYRIGENQFELEGYVDGYVKKGMKIFLKIRKIPALMRFDQRACTRIKVAIKMKAEKVDFSSERIDTINTVDTVDTIISSKGIPGLTMDISNGGVAIYLNTIMATGEVVEIWFPKIQGSKEISVRAEICWIKKVEKESEFNYLAGLKFSLDNAEESADVEKYVEAVCEIMS